MASRDAVSWNSGERWGDDYSAGCEDTETITTIRRIRASRDAVSWNMSEDISGRKQEKKERQAEESRPRMKREEARLRHCREILKGSGKG